MSDITGKQAIVFFLVCMAALFAGIGTGALVSHNIGHEHGREHLCSDLFGRSSRYIEGRCYVASPDGSLVPAKGAK